METFTLSRKELHRPGLSKALGGGRLTNAQVAIALGITVRQVRRLRRRFEQGGPGAFAHGNQGRPSRGACRPPCGHRVRGQHDEAPSCCGLPAPKNGPRHGRGARGREDAGRLTSPNCERGR